MQNIVNFEGNKSTAFVCLFQYDYGQELIIEGLKLPDDFEVHYSNGSNSALVIQGRVTDDKFVVNIPDEVLSQNIAETKAWIYLDEGKSGRTIKTIVIHLEKREIPSDMPPQEDIPIVKGYAEYVKENAEKVLSAEAAGDKANKIAEELLAAKENGEFIGAAGPQGPPGATGPPGKDAVTDAELSTESSNAIANKAVANILSSGNLIGIERISSLEDFEQFQSKYEDVPATDNQYLLLFVTEDIYSGEELTLEKGLIVLTPTDGYKLTCSKELEEFKKAVELNFNLHLQMIASRAGRDELEQVKTDLLRSIELLQSQTEQKISTTNKNVLQLTARVDELEKEWITVCDDTLTEDISFLLKTTDAEGNPFSFKKLKVYIYSPVNEATGNTGVRIINSTNYSDMDNILVQTSNWFMNTLSQHCIATVDCEGFAVTETNRGPTMDKMNNTGIMGVNFNVESITSVLIRPISTTAKMIPGTRIVVKGC